MSRQTGSLTVDASIASLAGTSEQLLAANPIRQFLEIHNPNASNKIAYSFGSSAALNAAGSYTLAAGATATYDIFVPTGAVQVIGTASDKVTCTTTASG